jgi:hypothetical protein
MISTRYHRNLGLLPALAFVTLVAAACKETKITDVLVDVANIDVNPTSLTMQVGEVLQVSAVAKSASGRSLTARPVQWSSSNTAVVEVAQNGTVTARGPGDATLTATSGDATKQVPVTVIAPPRIVLTPATIRFDAEAGGANPQPQTINVTNSGAGTITGLNAQVRYTQGTPNWLDGSTISQFTTPAVITLRANISGLAPGTYTATITVTGNNATNNPQTAVVTLVVAQPAGFTLTVQGAGLGSGTVTGNGINCTITNGNAGGTCAVTLPPNTVAQLTATPAAGNAFTGWNGACTNTSGPCQVTMTANQVVVAAFVPPTPPTIGNGAFVLVTLNSGTCANGGSVFSLSFDYADPNGDVAGGNTLAIVFTGQPSGGTVSFNLTTATFTGNGFTGQVGFNQCIRFNADTSVTYDIRLADSAQLLGNQIRITIAKPTGAN